MKVIITPRAEADIANQHQWGVERFGKATADRTFSRIVQFIEIHLAEYPRAAGNFIAERDVWEAYIARTPFIVMFRIEDADVIRILALFHHAQDRSTFGGA